MKYKYLLYLAPLAIVFLLFWGIGVIFLKVPEKSPVFNYIPQEVSQLMQINPGRIFKKFAYQRIFREKQTIARFPDSDNKIKNRISDDPGIDFFSPVLLMKEKWAEGDVWIVVLALNDAGKFEQFIQKNKKNLNVIYGNNEEVAIFALPIGPKELVVAKHIDNIIHKKFKPYNFSSGSSSDYLSMKEDISFLLTNRLEAESIFESIQGKGSFDQGVVNIEAEVSARENVNFHINTYQVLLPKGLHINSVVSPKELLPFILPENIKFFNLPEIDFFSMNIKGATIMIHGEDDTLSSGDFTIVPNVEILVYPKDKVEFEAYLNQKVMDSILIETEKENIYKYGFHQEFKIIGYDKYYHLTTQVGAELNTQLVDLEHVAEINMNVQYIFDKIEIKMPADGLANFMIEKTLKSALEKQLKAFENLKELQFFVDPSDEKHLKANGSFFFTDMNSHSIIELLIFIDEIDRLNLF